MSIKLATINRKDWETPPEFFKQMTAEYGPFDLDVCADQFNKKVDNYISIQQNGLVTPWQGVCWCNPPYGDEIKHWIKRAVTHCLYTPECKRVVMLLPSRTDTKWFHELILPYAKHVKFIKGRLKFVGAENPAPFPSMIAVFDKISDTRAGEGCFDKTGSTKSLR